jgi:carbon starvation protein
MVTGFYLWRRSKPVWFIAFPLLVMLVMPVWAMLWQMFNTQRGWFHQENHLLFGIGAAIIALQVWMVIEGVLVWRRAKGVLEAPLPPLAKKPALDGGRTC